jgi:hypothetical protein
VPFVGGTIRSARTIRSAPYEVPLAGFGSVNDLPTCGLHRRLSYFVPPGLCYPGKLHPSRTNLPPRKNRRTVQLDREKASNRNPTNAMHVLVLFLFFFYSSRSGSFRIAFVSSSFGFPPSMVVHFVERRSINSFIDSRSFFRTG